jgi:hypothetical protein
MAQCTVAECDRRVFRNSSKCVYHRIKRDSVFGAPDSRSMLRFTPMSTGSVDDRKTGFVERSSQLEWTLHTPDPILWLLPSDLEDAPPSPMMSIAELKARIDQYLALNNVSP